eukprot:365198-Chlamydomonas_euryale.AAC.6
MGPVAMIEEQERGTKAHVFCFFRCCCMTLKSCWHALLRLGVDSQWPTRQSALLHDRMRSPSQVTPRC